jgi:hypothetical protein
MSYNGREVMREVAESNEWTLHETPIGDSTIVAYERGWTQVLIAWTPENTARFVAKQYGTPDQVIAKGPGALIEARSWIEKEN